MTELEAILAKCALRDAIRQAVHQAVNLVLEQHDLTHLDAKLSEYRKQHETTHPWAEALRAAFSEKYQRITWPQVWTALGVEETPEHRKRVSYFLKALGFRKMTVLHGDARLWGWGRD